MTASGDFPLDEAELTALIEALVSEDVGSGDITSAAVIPEGAQLSAVMTARQALVVAGLPFVAALLDHLAPGATIDIACRDGEKCGEDQVIAHITGPARGLLTAERIALNMVQHLSGIATLTRQFVDKLAGTGAVLLDTRKTTPGLRKLEKYATRMGGARNHRMGLYDAMLIKDNHIAVAGGIEAAIAAAKSAFDGPIEVECDTLEQVEIALASGAERLLLDNMTPRTLRRAVALVEGKIPLEASGGVTLQSIAQIAVTGVDYISVGQITQSAPAVDIGMDYVASEADG